jgi:hypothetical protein
MNEYKIITIDDYEEVVTDMLLYIEKETDIQFEYETAGGSNELIAIETCNPNNPSIYCQAEAYTLDSYNYCVLFVIYVCEREGIKRVFEIALLPFDSESDETYIKAFESLTEILPDIPITKHLRKSIRIRPIGLLNLNKF